ncbi:hypothetical protein Poli38472_007757 [Pythium oligandrum]|uniref:Tetraspanin n=1 Tax=Pythium oligandrum TaxID=41045 RepID=A0A8K1FLC0_PYTOL|nr:hypothetical protein Poli38472_007757 [Pythium oligandrum]|eukprot:TMW68085.1 hypothetical protein Poli38472_007757 [Pythium oligandrum]
MGASTWRTLSRGILVFSNVLFLLLGTVLVALGGYTISRPDLNEFADGGISGAIITCGSLILLIALLGCCGAQWDSKVFLFPYATLVVVSVIGQFVLAGFMFHVHGTLVEASKYHFDLSKLSEGDRNVLKWINHRFEAAYNECGLDIDLNLSVQNQALVATCANQSFEWFANFIERNCRVSADDLQLGSDFMRCAGANFSLSDELTEHTMICACEARMINFVNDQSMLIAVFVFTIAFFEIMLVLLSCYVMCTRRTRRHGYQEIRMPVKQQQPYNPHPRNYYPPAGNSNQSLQASLQAQPSYSAMSNSPSKDRSAVTARPVYG